MKILEPESRFMLFLDTIKGMLAVGLLCLLFSIPIITAGAAYTAAYHSMTRTVIGKSGYIFRGYISAFKSNFGQSTLIWLRFLTLHIFLFLDLFIIRGLRGEAPFLFVSYLLIALSGIVFVVGIYALSYQARFEQKRSVIIKNAFLMALKHLPVSLMIFAVIACTIVLLYLQPVLILVLPGPVIMAYSYLLEGVFRQYM